MVRLALAKYFVIVICSINTPDLIYAQTRLDSEFINWNRATVQSLKMQKEIAADSLQKALYQNRLLSVKEYWGIRDIADLNGKSIRYKLLKTVIAKSKGRKKGYYIIEANETGSKVLLRSFVLYPDTAGIVDIEFYNFVNGVWKKTGKATRDSFHLQVNLKNYKSQFGKGFNNDDIIISQFENGHVKESEYFLFETLSGTSNIKKILESYRKENFIE